MLNSLQACRAVAAILVVLYHTSHGIFRLDKYFGHKPFGPIFDFGYAGVDFFFVLSGFIMMHIHAADIGQPRALGAYLWKRVTRIYPAYWVVLAAILPVYFLVKQFGFGHETDLDVIWRAFLLFPHAESHQVLGVAWTLVYEVFFYLLFGLLLLNKRAGLAVFVVWTAGVCAYPWFETYPWNFVFSPLHVRFLAGIGVALFLQHSKLPRPRAMAIVGAAIFVGAGMCEAFVRPLDALEQMAGFTVGSVLMLAGVVEAERSGLLPTPRWLTFLGNASYSIYLVHFLSLSVLDKLAKASHADQYLPSTILFALHALGAIAIGCAFHLLIERPLHAWTKQFFRRERPVPVAQSPVEPIRQAA